MAEKTLIAKVHADEKDPETLLVASPVVGMADGAPRAGVFLNPFDRIITVKILNQRYVLRLPRDVHGRVTEVFIPNSYTPVAYGEPIARLDPRVLAGAPAGPAGAAGADVALDETDHAHLITIQAPSEGIFYRRSSPDSPPYVEVGSKITTGSVLGLVEIMKCFNQITYGGAGLPESGQVAEILAEDASEVQFGQVLFRIRPGQGVRA
ncbi:MAG: biotin/lipoyl-containing protein [Planctomycetota bacterium]|jgi:acetyl-CoA carboxylase biotin carboxyl carrier protein